MSFDRPTTDPPTPAPPAALLAEVHRDLDALAAARRRRMAVFSAVALALVAGLGYALGHRDGHFVGPGCGRPVHAVVLTGFTALGLGLVGLSFGLSLHTGRRLRVVPPLGVVAGLVGLGVIAARYATPPGAFWHGIGCLGTGAVIALVLVVATLTVGGRLLRRHAPTAALFGVGVGLLGLVTLSLACPDASIAHLMVWHGAIPLAAAALAAIGWRLR